MNSDVSKGRGENAINSLIVEHLLGIKPLTLEKYYQQNSEILKKSVGWKKERSLNAATFKYCLIFQR
ncbi:hypothetical protein PZB74_21910 [Porifericola rhodea]|uniref:hypothetical protein n=1 Tax=Porifericola rhodea TaxID=930972 RepID=UPI0026652FBC|nr:hypothetical protein [Porifericola rhodea]WKN31604.1 hypothetical protein PZB74_21910 [Porifericola rhodea]